jgi:hypothetical protein
VEIPQSSNWSSWSGVTPCSRSVITSPQTRAVPSSSTCTNALGQKRSRFQLLQKAYNRGTASIGKLVVAIVRIWSSSPAAPSRRK